MPKQMTGVLTRARASIAHEYTQQRLNDDAIKDAIGNLPGDMGDEDADQTAPKPQHTLGSMDTINVNLWDSVFRGDGWRIERPQVQALGVVATCPGVTIPGAAPRPTWEMPPHLEGLYSGWSVARAGWAVLVPNRFLSESSFHTGYTPSWTHGAVIGEGVHSETGRNMVLVDLGWCDLERLMEEKHVRVARGPGERAIGSEDGHGHGWKTQEHCLGSTAAVEAPGDGEPKSEEVDATQNSTARTTFPKVRASLAEHTLNKGGIHRKDPKFDTDEGGRLWAFQVVDVEGKVRGNR